MIKTIAECDGPACSVSELVDLNGLFRMWPDAWIVISLVRSRDSSLLRRPGIYGFHSPACLTAWTRS